MANITITEAQYLRDLGQMVLETLEQVGTAFEREADEVFTGQAVSDFLYGRAVSLQTKYQARINELEAQDGE